MIFSSIPFLYYFLPLVIMLYFVAPRNMANSVLLLASLFFYGYGEPKMLLVMVATIVFSWALGLKIPEKKGLMWVSIVVSLGVLVWFKYMGFFVESFADAFGVETTFMNIALPAGISFYTFQTLSYTIDLGRGHTKPQKSLLDFAMYVALFPQLIAGPIVVYSDIENQLDPVLRKSTWDGIYEGICRFCMGLGKKVILANNLAIFVQDFQALAEDQRSVAMYWAYALAFAMQIYFDFSGYSDMAIGLGKIFGFTFPENFNYPFISKDISEFWRRWHMTLGGWFREYVYIPLGGNRVSKGHWIFNIFMVWGLTGFWHGANWTFLAWGIYFGIFLLMEKFFIDKLLGKLPAAFGHIYTVIVVLFSMVLFNANTIGEAASFIGSMVGLGGGIPFMNEIGAYYFRSYGLLFAAGIIGCTPLVKKLRLEDKLGLVISVLLLLIATAYLVDGSYNPFLYFRF